MSFEQKLVVVIDTETTGFGKTDRILEVAAVTVDPERGEIVDEFDTLINPMRDIPNSWIHGITSGMVASAPTFEEVAIPLANLADGQIIAAHNLPFDARLMKQEFMRLSADFNPGVGIDTLRLTNEKLEAACRRYGIGIDQQHRALSDARATAELLCAVYDRLGHYEAASFSGLAGDTVPRTYRREHAKGEGVQNTVHGRRRSLFPTSDPAHVAYLDVLDYFLDDLVLSKDEKFELQELSAELGLQTDELAGLHLRYFASLKNAAKRDGMITPEENLVLSHIAEALEIDHSQVPEISLPTTSVTAEGGERVCFTGEVHHADRHVTREELELRASLLGMIPVATVTKKGCDLVVAADPSSMSGKAKKARDFGIRVVSPESVPGLLD